MNDDLDVVLASNRGPVSFLRGAGGFETKRGAGGLAGALDPVARTLGDRAVWIAATNSDTDREALAAGAADDLRAQLGYHVYLLDIPRPLYSQYYDVVSNRILWFANHCLWDELGIAKFGDDELVAWDAAYEPVNQRFAHAIAEVAQPSSLILVQDYHLAAVPTFLRELLPRQTIFHFTHSSFCGPRGLERAPRPIPRRVIEGMLGADLVGFHVDPWARNFFLCCEQIGATVDPTEGVVSYAGRRTWVRSYPIPIDADELTRKADSEAAVTWAKRFAAASTGYTIMRADRAEPSKNIVRGFQAYEMVLDRRRDLRDQLRFVACLYPSRQSMKEYRAYGEQINETVDRINARYPGSIELFMKDDFDRTLGAYKIYDVLLVNSIMDGMNLVSKEGPALNERDGVLVITTGVGAFSELGDDAIVIEDAVDVEATASAIERAVDLPQVERARVAARLKRKASSSKPADWIEAQIADLSEVKKNGAPRTPPPTV